MTPDELADIEARINVAKKLDTSAEFIYHDVPALIARVRELEAGLAQIVAIIESAGLINLTNGVQLGPTAWFVKASDAVGWAKHLLSAQEPGKGG